MKKHVAVLLYILACSFHLMAQYANSWVEPSQKYYRIPITAEGVYRISYADLLSNGISAGDFDHRNLQIIHNGDVLPLYVSAQSDGIFRSTDYIEFYAPGGNTGWLDAQVYYSSRPFNEAHSLYNDTASYFLTFANTLESPRYDTIRTTNYEDYTAIPYCIRTVRANYYSTFNETKASPYILPSEGWCDSYFDMGGSTSKTLITPNYASVGLPSTISFGIGGFSETQHDIVVSLESDASVQLDTTYYDYNAIHTELTTSEALQSTTTLTFQSVDGDKTADKNSVSYIEITYPAKCVFNNQTFFPFTLPLVEEGDYILLSVTSFNAGSALPLLFCPDIQKRLLATSVDGTYQFLIPNAHKEMKCVMVSQNAMSHVSSIQAVETKSSPESLRMVDYSDENNQGDYIIITDKSLWTQAYQYKLYRQATGHTVVLVDVDELYNQFSYGIRKHPCAISNFIEYALNTWSITPEHVFLIGKGYHLTTFRNNETMYAKTLVPVMGNPASDLLYTMSTHGTSTKTNIAIGRIAAETSQEVAIYLNKIKEYEAQEPSAWMKTVLHFGGGSTLYEQSMLRYYLSRYAAVLEGEHFGADVHSFYKESSDVYETTEPEAIRNYVNSGTTLMTFFGHASGSGFDQNIDHPSRFDNRGRYPFILANSCYSGDIFANNDYNVSQLWTFAENRGAIGFLANVDVGMPSYLNIFSSAFIRNIAVTNYGKSVGSSIAKAMSDISSRNLIYEDLYDGIVGFTLQGDPAVCLPSFEYPDFAVDESSLFFTPSVLTTDLETLTFNVAVKNNARAYASSFGLRAVFMHANGDSFTIDTIVTQSYCHDTMSYVLPMSLFTSGEYTVSVTLDYENEIQEMSEENNTSSISFFVSSREMMQIYPRNYAIIPTDTISLIMSAVDPFNPPSSILVEIDTTASYDSPLKQSVTLDCESKALMTWKPEGQFIDSTVYFWRVTAADSIVWKESSFTYEKGNSGWAQIHAHQFIDNALTYMEYDEDSKTYEYASVPHEFALQTRGNCSTEKEYFECTFVKDATLLENSGFPLSSPALHVIVLDSTTLNPWLSSRDNYGQRNYPSANGRVRYHLAFTSNSAAAQQKLALFLLDSVPDGNYIMCYSFKNPYCQSWDSSLKDAMETLGFSAYKTAPDTYPYIFYTHKGDPSSCEEVVGTSDTDLISFSKVLYAHHNEGAIQTDKIGPADEFQRIIWNTTKSGDDYTYLSMLGVTNDDNAYVMQNIFTSEYGGLDTIVNAEYFPYLELNCYMSDDARTPADLNYWKVYYTPSAELAVAPEEGFSFYADTVQQGDSLRIAVAAVNVASVAMDSVLILYEIRNDQNELAYSYYKRVSGVDAYSVLHDTQVISTANLVGNYTIKIEFNTVNPETGMYDRAEGNHFNNTIHYTFVVESDKSSPVLDVRVDGRHLMNGDIVAQAPTIQITLYDENQFFALQDTSLVSVSITNLLTNTTTSYYYADGTLRCVPSEDGDNILTVYFTPVFTEDGQYELHVQGYDVTGNATASQDYVVDFVIQSDEKVSILYNYPNPCKDFTTFRFVLSGASVPKNARITIVNDLGEIVRIIPLSTIHIGTNTIDVNWDGRDNLGKDLQPGVYIYYLDFDDKASWDDYPLKQTSQLHKKYGRMILLR